MILHAQKHHLAPLQACYCTPKAYQLHRKRHAIGLLEPANKSQIDSTYLQKLDYQNHIKTISFSAYLQPDAGLVVNTLNMERRFVKIIHMICSSCFHAADKTWIVKRGVTICETDRYQ